MIWCNRRYTVNTESPGRLFHGASNTSADQSGAVTHEHMGDENSAGEESTREKKEICSKIYGAAVRYIDFATIAGIDASQTAVFSL